MNEQLRHKIEFEIEKLSMNYIEFITRLDSKTKDSIEHLHQSISLQSTATKELAHQLDSLVEKGSELIHSLEVVSMDMDLVDRLLVECKSIGVLLDQLEKLN